MSIDNYKRAIELCPNVAYYYERLGSVLIKQDKLDEALTVCRQAIQLDSSNPNYYRIMGNIQLLRGNIDDALRVYQQAINIKPEQMKRIFIQMGNYIKENLGSDRPNYNF